MEWRMADIFKLINLYKQNECLWNYKSQAYKSIDLRNNAWLKVASECGKEVHEVKKKIKHLRTAYVVEKKKVENRKKSGLSMYEPHLFYYSRMSFLDPVVVWRTVPSKLETDALLTPDSNISQNAAFDDNVSLSASFNDKASESVTFDENTSNSEITETFFEFCTSSSPSAKKRKTCDEPPAQLVKESVDISSEKLTQDKSNVFHVFGESVATQLKQLPQEEAFITMAQFQSALSRKLIKNLHTNLKQKHK